MICSLYGSKTPRQEALMIQKVRGASVYILLSLAPSNLTSNTVSVNKHSSIDFSQISG